MTLLNLLGGPLDLVFLLVTLLLVVLVILGIVKLAVWLVRR